MGVILFGGAQYSLHEQANLTLIFFPKIVGEGGGGEVTKYFFPDIPQNIFPDIPTNILQNSPDIAKKIHIIFAEIQKFFYDIKISQKSLCFARISQCPTVNILGGHVPPPHAPPAHTPMNMGSPFPFLYLSFSAQIPFSHACT